MLFTGAGVFLLASAESEQISFLFDCIVRGISPTRGPFGLRPVLPGQYQRCLVLLGFKGLENQLHLKELHRQESLWAHTFLLKFVMLICFVKFIWIIHIQHILCIQLYYFALILRLWERDVQHTVEWCSQYVDSVEIVSPGVDANVFFLSHTQQP